MFIHSPAVVVIRGSSEDLETVQVTNSTQDGKRTQPDVNLAPAVKDIIHVTIPLERGVNNISFEVNYMDHESEQLKLSILYNPAHRKLAEVPVGFEPHIFHDGNLPASCATCHDMNIIPSETLPDTPTQSPCYPCHKRLTQRKFVHGPNAAFHCLTCHRQGSAGFKLVAQGDTLCFLCHVEEKSLFHRKFIHGPVSTGDCLVCNDEHSSDYQFMLRNKINSVCSDCHPKSGYVNHPVNRHPVSGVPDPLRPGRELSCTSCHNPHSSDVSQFMFYRSKSSFSICSECHAK